jgi:ribose transport system permease protein
MYARLFSDYGMLLVLMLLCAFLSVWTIREQHSSGAAAGEELAATIIARTPAGGKVVILARDSPDDRAFADALEAALKVTDRSMAARVNGQPSDAVQALQKLAKEGVRIDAIAVTQEVASWAIFDDFAARYPLAADAPRLHPTSHYRSTFLSTANLLNVASQIAVIAIMAIGMTMVIITGGIDLSVGSLLALSAVLCTLLIRDIGGGYDAGPAAMLGCGIVAVLACAAIGLGTGWVVTAFQVPPFIVTLGVMLVARGLAGKLTAGQSVFELPDSFTWLGRDSALGLIPNAVVLMVLLYLAAHVVMTRTVLGRYIYAVGSNRLAARFSGLPVERVLITVYAVSAALAGLGGVIIASQLRSGSPTYGNMYELYVIAAVVVGGTSLSGGEGKIFGTLIGAFLIAVIQNGMNLLGLSSFDQYMVLGAVLVLAILLDRAKHLSWRRTDAAKSIER